MNYELETILSKVEEKVASLKEEIVLAMVNTIADHSLICKITSEDSYVFFPLECDGEIYRLMMEDPDPEAHGPKDFDFEALTVKEIRTLASDELTVRIYETYWNSHSIRRFVEVAKFYL